MSEPWTLEIDATHLYPGARGRFVENPVPEPGKRGACLLAFSDQVIVNAALHWLSGRKADLSVDAYQTAARTRIAAKRWNIALDEKAVRVVARET